MGGACSTHEADEKYITKFWLECLKGIDHSQDLGVDVKLLLKLMLRKCVRGCVEWIHLAQDMDRWRGIVNTVMKPLVP
jgi:hypothetical protein